MSFCCTSSSYSVQKAQNTRLNLNFPENWFYYTFVSNYCFYKSSFIQAYKKWLMQTRLLLPSFQWAPPLSLFLLISTQKRWSSSEFPNQFLTSGYLKPWEISLTGSVLMQVIFMYIITKSMGTLWLVNQLCFIVPVNLRENHVFWIII